jgi:hypothetical protein
VGAARHPAAALERLVLGRLEARDLPVAEVRLVRVTDLGPYLAGPATW